MREIELLNKKEKHNERMEMMAGNQLGCDIDVGGWG